MPQSDQESIQMILIEIGNLEKIMTGKSKEDLENDLVLERAVSMTLGLIGEKASKVTTQFRVDHPEIEWRKIIALRNRIVHSYEDLDFDIIHKTIEEKIPELKKQVEELNRKINTKQSLLPKKRIRTSKGKRL